MGELFTAKNWIGEFFTPDDYENRFAGQIDYSPETGVVLFFRTYANVTLAESDVVHGILLDSGEKCTLFGKFPREPVGYSARSGLSTAYSKIRFFCMLIGDFVQANDLFFRVDFSLTHMQDFFFPKGQKDLIPYSTEPLLNIVTPYGGMSVCNHAKFSPLSKDISAIIYSHDDAALEELKHDFEAICVKHPNADFWSKKDIAYIIHMEIDDGATISEAMDMISNIGNIFAILLCNPVYPESITIHKIVDDSLPIRMEIYPNMVINRQTLLLCMEEKSHYSLPIKNSNSDIKRIVTNWLSTSEDYSIIVSAIQHETGFRDLHSVHGEIVLYTTQLESITNKTAHSTRNKYKYPIENYGCPKIEKGFKSILNKAGAKDIGKGISDLRNEIAHVGKPKKMLKMLDLDDLIKFSQLLQMTIIGYILQKLGVDVVIIRRYQEVFTPVL